MWKKHLSWKKNLCYTFFLLTHTAGAEALATGARTGTPEPPAIRGAVAGAIVSRRGDACQRRNPHQREEGQHCVKEVKNELNLH